MAEFSRAGRTHLDPWLILKSCRHVFPAFPKSFLCARIFLCYSFFGMISIATKRITTTTSMSTTSTKAKSTIFASGAWRNS